MRTYSAVVYRDEPDEAAVEWLGIGDSFPSPKAARDAIRRVLAASGGFHYGSIHEGELTPAAAGVSPAHFESDEDAVPWQVGPDCFERG